MKNKKSKLAIASFLLGLVLALSGTPVWSNGFGVGQGAGSVELEFVYLTANLDNYLRPCRPAGSCALTKAQRVALERLVSTGTHSLAQSLQFRSAEKFPGLFPIDPIAPGQPAIYSIDPALAKVTINLDRLYPMDSAGRVSPLAWKIVLETVAEFAARREGLSADEARSFGTRIAARWMGSVAELSFARFQQSARALFIGGAAKDEAGQLLFADDRKVIDLTAQVLAQLPCPTAAEHPSRLLSLSHLGWVSVQAASAPSRISARARGEVLYTCANGIETSALRGKLDLGLTLSITGATVDELLKGAPEAQLELDSSNVVAQGSSLSVQPL